MRHPKCNSERPCTYARCRYNLIGELVRTSGGFRWVRRFADVDTMEHTCALDVADEGPSRPSRVARLMGVTQTMVDVLEKRALSKIRTRYPWLREHMEDGE